MNLRKVLIIGIAFLFTLLLGLGAYNLFFLRGQNQLPATAPPALPPPEAVPDTEQTFLPRPTLSPENRRLNNIDSQTGVSRLALLSEGTALGLVAGPKPETVRYYQAETGHVFEVDVDGSSRSQITAGDIFGLEKVLWSPDRSRVLTVRKEGGRRRWAVYDYREKKGVTLDRRIKSVVWSPRGNAILYHFADPIGTSDIAIADWDGRHWRIISPTDFSRLELFWPSADEIYIHTFNEVGGGQFLYRYSLSDPGQGFRPVVKQASELTVGFSPSGQWLMIRQRDGTSGRLEISLRNLESGQIQPLNLPLQPQKCAWSSDEQRLYCAVKASEVLAAGIFSEEAASAVNKTSDTFWQVDLGEAQVREIFSPAASRVFEVSEIAVSLNEDRLLFINKLDGRAYSLRL